MKMMWRACGALLLAVAVTGCGFAGINPRSPGSATGPVGHEVVAGESIYSIAARYGTTAEELASRNGIGAPYQLTVGQRLVVPPPAQYVVQPGETLNEIARRYGTTPAELARINGIGAPYPVQAGQTLTMPQALLGGGPALATAAPSSSVQVSTLPPSQVGTLPIGQPSASAGFPSDPTTPAGVATGDPIPLVSAQGVTSSDDPTQPVVAFQAPALDPSALGAPTVTAITPDNVPAQTLPPASTAVQPAASTNDGALPVLSGSGFMRPVPGQVVSAFGEGTVPNDGVNISAPTGTPILAAEAGVVAYVGEDIDTFGNLTLIRHADGWVTAYGHAEAILVVEGESVSRGQVLGRVGQSGAVSSPQLHFELRRGTEPVDPLAYLDG